MPESRLAIISNTSWSIYNFRKEIISEALRLGHQVTAIAPADRFVDKIEAMGVEFLPLQNLDPKGTNPAGDLRLYREFRKIFASQQFSSVFSFTAKPNIYSGLALRGQRETEFFPTVNGLGSTVQMPAIKRLILHRLYKRSFRRAKRVFFQNTDDIDYFSKYKLLSQGKSIQVAGSGVNTDEFYQRPAPQEGSDLTFLFSGRLVREKGVIEYVRAAERIKEEYPACRFLILGLPADNPGAISPDEIREMTESGVVEFLGHRENMAAFLDDVDIVVLPSYYREGIPRTLIEALSKGLPVITTDFTGCRETVVPGKNGLLVRPGSVEDLVSAIRTMIRLPISERVQMGQASRKLALEKFDVYRVISQYLEMVGPGNLWT